MDNYTQLLENVPDFISCDQTHYLIYILGIAKASEISSKVLMDQLEEQCKDLNSFSTEYKSLQYQLGAAAANYMVAGVLVKFILKEIEDPTPMNTNTANDMLNQLFKNNKA